MKKIFYLFVAALFCTYGYADLAVTVNPSGNATQGHFPVFGDNADSKGQIVQALYLATQLKGIAEGKEIKALTFYSSNQTQSWGKAEFRVSLAKTDYSYFQNASGAYATASTGSEFTKVFEGPLSVADGELTVNFTTPYAYEGGNLVIQVEITTAGSYAASSFYSASNTDYLIKYAKSGSSREQKQPKVTFVIADGGDDPVSETCAAPTAVTIESITDATATISWQGEASQYQYCLEFEGDLPDWTAAQLTSQKSVTLSGLYDEQKYYLYVRSYCSETEVSEAVKVTFKTACARLNVPWIETFTRDAAGSEVAGDVAPDCWTISSAAPAVTVVAEKEDDGQGNQIATGEQHLNARGGGATTAQVFALPLFNAKLDTCELAFDYYTNVVSEDYGKLEIGYMTNPADAATFVSLTTLEQTITSQHVVFPLDVLPAGIEQIAFRFAGGTSNFGSVNMDNFVMAAIGHSGEVDPGQEILPDAAIYSLSYCEAKFTWYSYNTSAFAIGLADESGTLIAGIAATTDECDRFAYQDQQTGEFSGFPTGDDYENHYYCSTKWILNVDEEGQQRGDAWATSVINVGTATSELLALKPGTYQVKVLELNQNGSSYSTGATLATFSFTLVEKKVENLQATVAADKTTATLTWTNPEFGQGERLYVRVWAGETIAYDNFDSKDRPTSPLTVNVIEGKSYKAIVQVLDRNNNPLGSEVQTDFTVGVNNYEPQNVTAAVFGGDNVTFAWAVGTEADRYVITLYCDGEYYSSLTVIGTSKTTTMPKDGTWTWTVQAFNQGDNGNYFEASKAVEGNSFVTKAADVPEDAIEFDIWAFEAAYLDKNSGFYIEGKHGWFLQFATGEEGNQLPAAYFLVYTNKEDAISGVYNVARANIDLESCYIDITGEQADAITAKDAEVRLQFDGFDEDKFSQGYAYGYYTGSFRLVGNNGKTYIGKFMEMFCNSYDFSSMGTGVLTSHGMWDEEPTNPTGCIEITNEQVPMTNKIIINGQLFIEKDGKIYNVLGGLVR